MDEDKLELISLKRKIKCLHRANMQVVLKRYGLYEGQPLTLIHLKKKGECTQKDLAEFLNVSNATIAVSLKRLEKSGLIKKTPDKKDLRYNNISLTEKGREIVDKCEDAFKNVDIHMFDGFSDEEIKNLKMYYARIIDNLEKFKFSNKGGNADD